MGLTMAPATESIMGSLPRAKAGVGSAMNDTTRQVGGALGVAIIGSVMSSVYGPQVADRVHDAGLTGEPVAVARTASGRRWVAADPPERGGEPAGGRRRGTRSSTACTTVCWSPPAPRSSVRSSRCASSPHEDPGSRAQNAPVPVPGPWARPSRRARPSLKDRSKPDDPAARERRGDDAILEAALAEYGERGFEAMSVEAVAARAGVSKATIYRRFESKLDLVAAAL